jgi:hypothetical protein
MMSSIVDTVLFVALLLTTGSVVLMYRKLKQLDGLQSDYQRALKDASTALTAAREAMTGIQAEGRDTLTRLGHEIEEAKRLITELDVLVGKVPALSRPTGRQPGGRRPAQE